MPKERPFTRSYIIQQTRRKQSADPGHQTLTKKQKQDLAVELSTVTFYNIHIIHDRDDLLNTIRNHIDQHKNRDEQPRLTHDTRTSTITVKLMEKNLTLSLARAVERATKHFHPEVIIHNPHDNIFYRIDVVFTAPFEQN